MIREFLTHLRLELNRSSHTVQAYETDLRGINEYLKKSGAPMSDAGFFVADSISTSDLREWMATLSESGASATTIRRKIQAIRAYYRYLMKTGKAKANPAATLPLPKSGRRLPAIATHADIEKSLEEAGTLCETLAIKMLYGCGLRRAELIGINDDDINPYTRELRVLGKGNKHRIIPLPESLMRRIAEWQEERDRTHPNLPSPKPLMATSHGRMSESTLYKMIRRALTGSGAEQKSPHTLRHSFATQLLNSGADINSVKNLLGHASLGATQIYTHLALAELQKEWTKAHPRAKK